MFNETASNAFVSTNLHYVSSNPTCCVSVRREISTYIGNIIILGKRNNKHGRQRNTKPPFSGLYSIPVPEEVSTDDEKEQLTSLERAIGFELRYINGVLSKVKTETNQRDGSKTFLRTWEVIRNSTGA